MHRRRLCADGRRQAPSTKHQATGSLRETANSIRHAAFIREASSRERGAAWGIQSTRTLNAEAQQSACSLQHTVSNMQNATSSGQRRKWKRGAWSRRCAVSNGQQAVCSMLCTLQLISTSKMSSRNVEFVQKKDCWFSSSWGPTRELECSSSAQIVR